MGQRSGYHFTTAQKRGILLLVLVLSLFGLARWLWPEPGLGPLPEVSNQKEKPTSHRDQNESRQITSFDINQADSTTWASLPGIGPVLSARIIKYRKAIGGFESVDELQKVYGLREETYQNIRPYLKIDPAFRRQKLYSGKAEDKPEQQVIDINKADSLLWTTLPGIGPVLSARIVKYRSSLGGFRSIEQLRKVYGLNEETFQSIHPFLRIDTMQIAEQKSSTDSISRSITPVDDLQKVDINLADSAALEGLPGIGPVTARRIVAYRNIIGWYGEVGFLRSVWGFSEENFKKAQPWLFLSEPPPVSFERLDLNSASQQTLTRYPLIDKEDAINILRLRRALGRFENWDELRQLEGITPEMEASLRFYFKI